MTSPLFPKPAATLPGEADILARVLADQSDDAAKLVYADWLQDRDDPRGPLLRDCVTAFRGGKNLPHSKLATHKSLAPWCALVGITLMHNIGNAGLGRHADKFLRLARPALDYKAVRASDKKIPVGASKLGGLPDLPAGVWPCDGEEPLSFLGQFNFAELSQSVVGRELPAAGLLSVFCRYDPDDENYDFPKGTWQVLHFPSGTNLDRALSGPQGTFRSGRLVFTETLTLPQEDSPFRKDVGLGNDSDAWDEYQERVAGYRGNHQLLGYPCGIQGDVLGKKTVRHLLTIGPDRIAGWEWGDGGSLYFTLREADLHAGRFDRVKMDMQCA